MNGELSGQRLLIVGRTTLLRDLVRAEAEHRSVEVVGDISVVEDCMAAAEEGSPTTIVIEAPEEAGWAGHLPELKACGYAVVVLSDEAAPDYVLALLASGADAVLRSDRSTSEVIDCVLTVGSGGTALDDHVATAVLEQWRTLRGETSSTAPRTELTSREQDVLAAMAEGLSTKGIARKLGVALKTVENHKTRVYQKLGARTNAHAVSLAIRLGLLQQPHDSASA